MEVKESTVKVSRRSVMKVRAVRNLRRFIFDMPSRKAVVEALARLTSVSWMTATSVRNFFICSLKRPDMIPMTSAASVKITKASRITKGLDSWKAGWTTDRIIHMTMKTPANPKI